MEKIGKGLGAGVSLFLFGAIIGCGLETPNANGQTTGSKPAETASGVSASNQQASSAVVPDHASAYYHFTLARRYQDLAGIYNRTDLVEKAIAEYKLAMQDDPDSLFLHTELAELYYRVSRVGDAISEAEGVLKVNPDNVDAHRLLASIYLHNLGETETNTTTKETLQKAIRHLEAVVKLEPTDINSYVTLGRLYRLDNQEAKAEETFRKALNADPNSKGALTFLAQLYSDQGDYKQAIEALKRIPDNEMDPPTLAMLAQAHLQAHDYDQATAAFEQALAQDPDNQDIREHYAEALMATGKTDAARAELKKILKADPEDGSAYLRLGHLDRAEGHFDDARQELQRAKTLLPDNMEVTYEQALLEDAGGNDDKAIQILQGLLKDSEKSDGQYTVAEANNRAIFLERLGLIYRSQEKYDQAEGVFKQIVALGKSQASQGEALIVETLRLNHQPQKALEEAGAAIARDPKNRQLVMLRASLLGEEGHVDEAIEQLQSLVNGTRSDQEVQLAMAQVYSGAKRFPEAEATAQKALAMASKPEDQEGVRFMLGSIYERQKKYDLAEEQFKKVLAVDPLNSAAANYLGYMLADRGVRLEESVKYIQKALQLEPNNGAFLDSLGWAYFKMHRLELAEGPLEKAARLISDDPTILEHLGNLHLQMGKERLAAQEWERALKDWPKAVGSDFDAQQAAQLQKKLDELKLRLAKKKSDGTEN